MARPMTNPGIFRGEPRHGHAFSALMMNPPTSPCPTLSAHASPKDIAGSDIMKLK